MKPLVLSVVLLLANTAGSLLVQADEQSCKDLARLSLSALPDAPTQIT